jgi:hypothetical protein
MTNDQATIDDVLTLMQEAQTLTLRGELWYYIDTRLRDAIMLTYEIESYDLRETLRFDISYWIRFDWYEYNF